MSIITSTNGHIEVINTDFMEFEQGSFRINKIGTDNKIASLAIIYDTPANSSVVQIKYNGGIISSSNTINLNEDTTTFYIESQPNISTGFLSTGQYSFNVEVRSNEPSNPIIDRLNISGIVREVFTKPFSTIMTQFTNNDVTNYNFDFEPFENDGDIDKIISYRVIAVNNEINLVNPSNGEILNVGSVSRQIVAVRKQNFTGRILFTLAPVDIYGRQRKSRIVVTKYDPTLVTPPTFVVSRFVNQPDKNNILAMRESGSGNNVSTALLRFILADSINNDGNFRFFWELLEGSSIVRINNNNLTSGLILINNLTTSPAILTFTGRENKFGLLRLKYGLTYYNEVIETSINEIELHVIPTNNVNLSVKNKRIYLMNKHRINLNDTTSNGYNLIQSVNGTFNWSSPNSSTPLDNLSNNTAVAMIIPSKENFDRTLVSNITKYDIYDGRTYDYNDNTIFLDIRSLRIHVSYSNGTTPVFKTRQSNINAILSSMIEDQLNEEEINRQLSYWTAENNLGRNDIIFDPLGEFYGKINIFYRVRDTLLNISNISTATLLICPYSNIRVVSVIGDDQELSLVDDSARISVVYENSLGEGDRFDFLSQESQSEIRLQMMRLTKGDIDFTDTIITLFTRDDEEIDGTELLEIDTIIDQNGIIYDTPVSINGINWTQRVTLNQKFSPVSAGNYDINFKILTNSRSNIGNSKYVFAKNQFESININVVENNTNKFEDIVCKSLSVINSSDETKNLFSINNSDVTSFLPVVIEENINGDSLTVSGTIVTDEIHASTAVLTNLNILGNITSNSILGTELVVTDQLNANLVNINSVNINSANINTLNVNSLNTDFGEFNNLDVSGNLTVSRLLTSNVESQYIKTDTIDLTGDISITGGLISDGLGIFNNGLEIAGELDVEAVSVSGTLAVSSATVLTDTTVDTLIVNYDSDFRNGLNVVNSSVRINNYEGFKCDLPTTIGSGTNDVILQVNGSTSIYGDLTVNDTDILCKNGEINLGLPVKIGSEESNADLSLEGNFYINNDKFTVENEKVVINLPTTFGETENVDININGNLTINEYNFNVSSNAITTELPTVINNDLMVSGSLAVDGYSTITNLMVENLNCTGSFEVSDNCLLGNTQVDGLLEINGSLETSGNIVAEKLKVSNMEIKTTNTNEWAQFLLLDQITLDSNYVTNFSTTYNLTASGNKSKLIVQIINISENIININVETDSGVPMNTVLIYPQSSAIFIRSGTEELYDQSYPQWKKIASMGTFLPM